MRPLLGWNALNANASGVALPSPSVSCHVTPWCSPMMPLHEPPSFGFLSASQDPDVVRVCSHSQLVYG